jgi:hypothetical protein
MSGVKPKAIFIDTNDTADEVVVAGYLDHIIAQGIPIANWEIALVTTRPTPNSSDITTAWYGITFSNGQWSLVAQGGGGAGVILPTIVNSIAVFYDTAGTISSTAATATNDGNIQAYGNLIAGKVEGTQPGELHVYPATENSGSVIVKAIDVTSGDHSSTIVNSADLTQAKVYTLPNTQNFTDPPTIAVLDNFGAPTSGNLALWGSHTGALYDGGPPSPTIFLASQTANLTSGTLTTLDASGIELVPNPNPGFPGYVLLVSYVVIKFTYATTPYANTTGNFYMAYDSAGTTVASKLLPQSVFTATENSLFVIYPDPAINDYLLSATEGNGLFFVADNNMTDGDSGVQVTVYYSIATTF